MSRRESTKPKPTCGTCIHFIDDPATIEKTWPGMSSFSSGAASVRARDGLCDHHDRYLASDDCCADHEPKPS
jgi:hypothetical protein